MVKHFILKYIFQNRLILFKLPLDIIPCPYYNDICPLQMHYFECLRRDYYESNFTSV